MSRGTTLKDISADAFIPALAAHFKRAGTMQVPEWSEYCLTGTAKQHNPYSEDWYYIRAAAIARQIYLRGATGVGLFKRMYGGSKNWGVSPSAFAKGSGSVARHILHQLEKLKIVERDDNKMRRLTRDGRKNLDLIAASVRAKAGAAEEEDAE
eukprot:GILI01018560.1.p2 GENE.GILI01018560.1~~GILI01018560.1.p2  ORF type:complete len:167 (-),score=55.44 GILI01018560.1:35-493(-)